MKTEDFRYFKNLSKLANTDKGKINFFNQNQKAFFLDASSDEWDDMMKEYAKINNLNENELEKIEEMKWLEIPDTLKLFAFEYCIINGNAYQE